MSSAKIAITLEETLLQKVDSLVNSNVFKNRSQAIQSAISDKISKLEKSRLAKECAKLNTKEEQSISEEGFSVEESEWPVY